MYFMHVDSGVHTHEEKRINAMGIILCDLFFCSFSNYPSTSAKLEKVRE